MRSTLLILILSFSFLGIQAQETADILFSNRTHDFGSVREEEGPFTHEFIFVNGSSDSLVIKDVKASCGCTVPSWTKTPIAPSDSGRISARYSADRSGTFSKNLQVFFEGRNEPAILHLQGKVIPRTKSPVELLPTAIGNLHLKYRSVNMGKVLTKEGATEKRFDIYNAGENSMFLDSAWHQPHAGVKFEPDTLKAGTMGSLVVIYDALAVNDLGFRSENLTLFTTDSLEPVKQINLYATIAEYFPPMTEEELKDAPHLKIYKPVYDFERIDRDSSYTATFTVTNSGQSLLSVRKLEVNCSCVEASINKSDIKPGREATVTVTFNTSNRLGNQQKSVTIYTNDPIAPSQRITLKAYIRKP